MIAVKGVQCKNFPSWHGGHKLFYGIPVVPGSHEPTFLLTSSHRRGASGQKRVKASARESFSATCSVLT